MKRKSTLSMLKYWIVLCTFLYVLQNSKAVRADEHVTPCELETIINQLINPDADYAMHAAALRNQLRNILNERQLAAAEEQLVADYQYPLDKRSVAALAAQGLLRGNNGAYKRGLATLAKNGQMPTQDPESIEKSMTRNDKRYLGSLARDKQQQIYGKRNVGALARDFQLPNGKRNLATMARLGLLSPHPKRNLAAIARYNSMHMTDQANDDNNDMDAGESNAPLEMTNEESPEKRNIGALKGSSVHGSQQKRLAQSEEVFLPVSAVADPDYVDYSPNSYWWYPNYAGYADLDWNDYRRAQKRFLDTSKDAELFGIENAGPLEEFAALARAYPNYPQSSSNEAVMWELPTEDGPAENTNDMEVETDLLTSPQKRHIGAVYRSGFLPTYRALRSNFGSMAGPGHFSRSGRARQFV